MSCYVVDKKGMLVGLLKRVCPKADGWGFYD